MGMTTRMVRTLMLFVSLALAAPAARADAPVRLIVDRSERELVVEIGDEVARRYDVAIGTSKYPTPSGVFKIRRLIWNPGWIPPDSKWARGKKPAKPGDPRSPVQVVKIPFLPLYYIHGTDDPESVGRAASHGCVRMRNEDIAELGRLLMEETGQERDPEWFDAVLDSSRSHPVPLGDEIELIIE